LSAKLSPWYCGPFEILERIGPMVYQLTLSPTVKVNDVLNISFLKKYIKDVDHIIDWFVFLVDEEGEFQ